MDYCDGRVERCVVDPWCADHLMRSVVWRAGGLLAFCGGL